MSDSKGPKVSLPEELRAEFEESTSQGVGEEPEEAAESEMISGEEEDPESALGDLRKEFEELNEKHLRLAAEFENFKRRALKERQELHNFANENLIQELLPTVDN